MSCSSCSQKLTTLGGLDEIARSGKDAILALLAQVGGWPVLEAGNWTEPEDTWEEYIAEVLNKTGVSAVLLELTISHDPNNSSKTSIELDQPKFGIGSRWPYMGGINESMVQNYTELMVRTAIALGNWCKMRCTMLAVV